MRYRTTLGFVITLLFLLNAAAFALPLNTVRAKAAIVMDGNDTIIYAKNPEAKLPPASTVKLVTAMVALDRLDPSNTVRISSHTASVRSVKPRIRRDEELTVSDLLHLALMKSINASAVALAEGVAGSEAEFVSLMNEKAVEIGALNTRFANASGLPGGVQHTTAYDLALILKKALCYPLIREIIGKREYRITTAGGRSIYVTNTNRLLWQRENMIGGKSGFTGSARHCFVGAMETEKGIILAAVLGAPSRSRLWRNTEVLLDLGISPGLFKVNFEEPGRGKHISRKKARKSIKTASRSRLTRRA